MSLNILFFTKGDKTIGSSRQRVWFLAEKLEKQYGYKYEVIYGIHYPFWVLSVARLKRLWYAAHALYTGPHDLIFIHKSFFPWDVVVLILAAKIIGRKKLVYDLDDAEWIHSPVKTALLAHYADAVFCGSREILAWVQKYSKRAVLIPTVLDAKLYASYRADHVKRAFYTIGWVGAGSRHFKDGHFHMIMPALQKLHKLDISFRFVIIGSEEYGPLKDFFMEAAFEKVFVDHMDWADPSAVPKTMKRYGFDIGLMPQSNTPFNRAKCSYKALEYMACGIPSVVSPVGENLFLIHDGVNGYFARDDEEWAGRIKELLRDEHLRSSMGNHACATIQERYSYDAVLPLIQEIFMGLVKHKKPL